MTGNTTSNTQYCDGVLLYIIQGGWTPLMTASKQGYSEVVQVLLSAGAQVNDYDRVSSFIIYSLIPSHHLWRERTQGCFGLL